MVIVVPWEGTGHNMLSVNDNPKVMIDSAGEALSVEAPRNGIVQKGVDKPAEISCNPGPLKFTYPKIKKLG